MLMLLISKKLKKCYNGNIKVMHLMDINDIDVTYCPN